MLLLVTVFGAQTRYMQGLKSDSFVFAVDWRHLGLRSKDEYEMRLRTILIFKSR